LLGKNEKQPDIADRDTRKPGIRFDDGSFERPHRSLAGSKAWPLPPPPPPSHQRSSGRLAIEDCTGIKPLSGRPVSDDDPFPFADAMPLTKSRDGRRQQIETKPGRYQQKKGRAPKAQRVPAGTQNKK